MKTLLSNYGRGKKKGAQPNAAQGSQITEGTSHDKLATGFAFCRFLVLLVPNETNLNILVYT